MNRPLKVPGWLRPSRTIPVTPWRSASRWRARPSTLGVLILGLSLFGTGEALLVVADLVNYARALSIDAPEELLPTGQKLLARCKGGTDECSPEEVAELFKLAIRDRDREL